MTVLVKPLILWVKNNIDSYPRGEVSYTFIEYNSNENVHVELGLNTPRGIRGDRYSDEVWTTPELIDSSERRRVSDVLDDMEGYLNLNFQPVEFGNDANISFGYLALPSESNGKLVGGRTIQGQRGPSEEYIFLHSFSGDGGGQGQHSLNVERNFNSTVRHEMMHALGFGPDLKRIFGAQDLTQQYTVLSYIEHPSFYRTSHTLTSQAPPTTFMVYDYLSFDLAGILKGYDAGSEHKFRTSSVLETIYDTVGIDLFDASNQSDSIIDLRQGQYSSIGSGSSDSGATGNGRAVQNVGIAYGTIIENAVAGSGEDVIIGNAYNNVLNGNRGDDYIYGDGLAFNADAWAANFSSDHIDAYRLLVGSPETLVFNIGEDTLIGGHGNDYLYGGAGNDHLVGDSGTTYRGEPGDDHLYGGAGNDILDGGEEFDSYYFNYGDGIDEVIENPENGGNDLWLQHSAGAGDTYTNVKRLGRIVTGATVFTEVDASGQPINDTTVYVLESNELGGQDLVVHIDGGKGGHIRIKNFGTPQDNAFDIHFVEPEAVETPAIVDEGRKEIGTGFTGIGVQDYHPRGGFRSSNIAIRYDAEKYVPNQDSSHDYYPHFAVASDTLLSTYWFRGSVGNDVLIGSVYETEAWSYYDELRGGKGNDHLYGEAINSTVGDSDLLHGGEGNDTLLGFMGNDNLQGGEGDDYIEGGEGEDKIYGSIGNDYIKGGTGDDTIFSAHTPVSVNNDESEAHLNVIGRFFDGETVELDFTEFDTVYGGDGYDRITGSAGSDKLLDMSGERSNLYGFIGNDTLITGAGTDFIYGDAYYKEVLEETTGAILTTGFTQFDWSVSDDYEDLIISGAGEDTIVGGAGDDSVFAGADSDIIFGDQINDAWTNGFYGPNGYVPLAFINQYYSELDPSLHGEDFLDGGSGNDFIYGNGGNDTITGGEGQDYIHGDDFVLAEQHHGNDTLLGGAGGDYLLGGGRL